MTDSVRSPEELRKEVKEAEEKGEFGEKVVDFFLSEIEKAEKWYSEDEEVSDGE